MNSSQAIVGITLAESVASRLEAGLALTYKHPEYCGVGLHCADGVFIVSESYDGDLLTEGQYRQYRQRGDNPEFMAFHSRAEFVAWLAQQSDQSLSGAHLPEWLRSNQRLTLARLQDFIA